MSEKPTHLNDDQLVVSIVDENDLPREAREHLLACPSCQEKREALVLELDHLGGLARDLTPLPQRKPMAARREQRRFYFRLPAFSAAVAVAFLALCLWNINLRTDSPNPVTTQLPIEAEMAPVLLDDILEVSVVPAIYMDIAGASTSYFDDEFVEFVVPLNGQPGSV